MPTIEERTLSPSCLEIYFGNDSTVHLGIPRGPQISLDVIGTCRGGRNWGNRGRMRGCMRKESCYQRREREAAELQQERRAREGGGSKEGRKEGREKGRGRGKGKGERAAAEGMAAAGEIGGGGEGGIELPPVAGGVRAWEEGGKSYRRGGGREGNKSPFAARDDNLENSGSMKKGKKKCLD